MDVKKKRDLMEVCHNLIPIMAEVELNALAVTLQNIVNHMIDRKVEVIDDEEKK